MPIISVSLEVDKPAIPGVQRRASQDDAILLEVGRDLCSKAVEHGVIIRNTREISNDVIYALIDEFPDSLRDLRGSFDNDASTVLLQAQVVACLGRRFLRIRAI